MTLSSLLCSHGLFLLALKLLQVRFGLQTTLRIIRTAQLVKHVPYLVLSIIIIIHTFLYRHKVVTSEAVKSHSLHIINATYLEDRSG